MRLLAVLLVCTIVQALLVSAPCSAAAAQTEKPSALNGSQYAVIAPVFDGSSGAVSYLRLFNGGTTGTTFSVTIVGAASGITLGATTIPVPANASVQYPLSVTGGNNSLFSQAGVGASGGAYALYIQNADSLAGYQHITYNFATTALENHSSCSTPIEQQLAVSNKRALINVHTSALSSYPATISLHNYAATSTTLVLTIYDASSGTNLGTINQTVAGNATLTLAESQIETQLNFHPTSTQTQINVFITNAAGGALPITATQSVRDVQLGSDSSMSVACAINAVPTTVVQAPPTGPVSYCGTATSTAYPSVPLILTLSVAPNGRVRAVAFNAAGGFVAGDQFNGTLNGSLAFLTATNGSGSGTIQIQSGAANGTLVGSSGVLTISASNTACN